MLEVIESSALGVWVRESPSIFAYTLVLSLHAIGLAIVVGMNTVVALRVLGFAPRIPLASLRSIYAAIWFSGVLLFVASATNMGTMPAFWAKITLVALGMFAALRLKSRYLDDPAAMAPAAAPAGARRLAWLSLGCWYLALIVGRLTGYPELVESWFGI
jgi:hypothetical protein